MTADKPLTLSDQQREGLIKLGDAMIPGDGDLPSFRETACTHVIDDALELMYDDDRESFLMLTDICAKLPMSAVRGIVALSASHSKAPEPLAGLLRMANIGTKGVVHALYWSGVGNGPNPLDVIGYHPSINVEAYEKALAKQAGSPSPHHPYDKETA